MEEKMIIA